MKTHWKLFALLVCVYCAVWFSSMLIGNVRKERYLDSLRGYEMRQYFKYFGRSEIESEPVLHRKTLNCTTSPRIVFIKNHKAASSTITVMLQRYGLDHNKTFALPLFHPYHHIFHLVDLFTANMTLGYQEDQSWDGFDILMNHARLNRPEMDKVVKNAFYLTIIRHPIGHFESAWGYFNLGQFSHLFKPSINNEEISAIGKFFVDPKFSFNKLKITRHFQNYIWNGQLFDLGLDQKRFDDNDYITDELQRLSQELDLVLIKEYFDESLILMKQALCLSYEDIIYIPSNMRQQKQKSVLSPSLRREIESWNMADMLMYNHFNRTFWDKVYKYGPTFSRDLDMFREFNENVRTECADGNVTFSITFPAIRCADLRKLETENTDAIRIMTKQRLNILKDLIGYPFDDKK